MPETSFVPGWVIGVLLVCVVIAFLLWLVGATDDDPWMLEKYGPHTEQRGCCDARRTLTTHEADWLCDRARGHRGQHFDTFAKQAWD